MEVARTSLTNALALSKKNYSSPFREVTPTLLISFWKANIAAALSFKSASSVNSTNFRESPNAMITRYAAAMALTLSGLSIKRPIVIFTCYTVHMFTLVTSSTLSKVSIPFAFTSRTN